MTLSVPAGLVRSFEVGPAAFYLVLCAVRTSMTGIETRVRIHLFLIRFLFWALGLGLAFGFLYGLCIPYGVVRDVNQGRIIMWMLFGLAISIGEFIARRRLRATGFFPKNRRLPWTY